VLLRITARHAEKMRSPTVMQRRFMTRYEDRLFSSASQPIGYDGARGISS
jgi:hypothetical protein